MLITAPSRFRPRARPWTNQKSEKTSKEESPAEETREAEAYREGQYQRMLNKFRKKKTGRDLY